MAHGAAMLIAAAQAANAQGKTLMSKSTSTSTIVKAPVGSLRGTVEGDVRVFRGIPYALPPVGSRRWQPPVPMPAWKDVREASEFGPACVQPQPKLSNIYVIKPVPQSEDCLTLNIWAPANAQNAAVFFWIYGGALWGGASRDPIYDGQRLAERGVIVVSINYRLGVLGWLAHPELSAESKQGHSGNYGLLDQVEALHWVRTNIAAFGGDASNVTIAGESAGALSVMYLMASPRARGLFAKAIAQSAYMITTPELKTARHGLPSAEESGVKLATALKAEGSAALRNMDAVTLTEAASALGFGPWGAVDGHVLPDQLVDVFDKARQARVPILAGFNSGEIRSLRVLAPPVPAGAAVYESTIRSTYGALADEFLRLYPSSDLAESVLAATRDGLYGWTAQRLVRRQAALGVSSYLYLFDHGYPSADDAGLHAFHASELPYVFGTLDGTPPSWPKIPATDTEAWLSNAMLDYWTSFARTGRPQAHDAPAWPAFGSAESYMRFAALPVPETRLMPGMYELNEEVMCRRRASGTSAWNWNVGMYATKLPAKGAGCD